MQTTVNGLNSTVKGRKILDVWSDYPIRKSTTSNGAGKMFTDSIKHKPFYKEFRKKVIGRKILKAERRAKNILIHLSGGQTMLVHMKMTGHFVYDRPDYPHVRFSLKLDNGKALALSDMRRFAKVTLIETKNLDKSLHLSNLGPEPLDEKFRIKNFESRIMKKPKSKIKTVLMDPPVIAGIGNIYSDEILWRAGVHPASIVSKIPKKNIGGMFRATKILLKKGIDFGGDSMSDYRNIKGERGKFQEEHKAYGRTGMRCTKRGCKGKIPRMTIGGRSAHFCNKHQTLYA